jgi:Domain of unknown function (DUF4338)/DDE_Tnp_1-associated
MVGILLYFPAMKTKYRNPTEREQRIVEQVKVRPIKPGERQRCMRLLNKYHYLGSIKPVGEQMLYVAVTPNGGWLGILIFGAAAKHLKFREKWINWTESQRRKRLSLITNNVRFLILPRGEIPNLASRVLRLVTDRISGDWQTRYGHPVVLVETFVNPEQFQGTVYLASGWTELGQTSGYGRCRQDYYVRHNKPKRLFVKPLYRNAQRSLQAEHLKPALAMVQDKVPRRCEQRVGELRCLAEHFNGIADFRSRIESYPIYSVLAIVACAHFAGAPRGPHDLSAFAKRLTRFQRKALGIRRDRQRRYPVPSAATFCRVLQSVEAQQVEEAILAYQSQIRGPASKDGMVAMDGKEPLHSQGQHIFTAVNLPDLYYLGSEMVDEKTNEIPVARELIKRLDLQGRLVGLDALHTQNETALELVQEAGSDYLLTVKKNQKGVRKTLIGLLADIPASFSPSEGNVDSCLDKGNQSLSRRSPNVELQTDIAGTDMLPGGCSDGQSVAASFRS